MTATVHEPARELPVTGAYDVIVCGGGPAGVSAAVAAGRLGSRVLLIEQHGCLGGIWTAGLLAYFLDYGNKTGMMAEIISRLEQRHARAVDPTGKGTDAFDPEAVKILLETMCREAGIDIRLYTRVASCQLAEGEITHVITESKSGREAFAGTCFVDATGDGDLGALSGCRFDLGHPDTGAVQPMSLICLITGIHRKAVAPFVRERTSPWPDPKDRLRRLLERSGNSPSYGKPSLFPVTDDLFILMANHQYGVLGTDADQLTAATLEARLELHALADGLRSQGPPWDGLRIVATGAQIGVREGRRIRGKYHVTLDDMLAGKRHDDAACEVTFGIDVHSTDPQATKGIERHGLRTKPYQIPLRALQAADRDNLWLAGRCISGDFMAHSSYRVTGNAVAMGEAVGRACAQTIGT